MYYVYDINTTVYSYYKCAHLPLVFDRNHLKLDVAFKYNKKQYVQHHALVTFE